MTFKSLIAATALALLAAGAAQARPAPPQAPGLDVQDRCMAAALTQSGWRGAIRIETPRAKDRSMRRCDLAAERQQVESFVATAKPCLAQDLRAYGYLGRIRPPHHSAYTSQDPACDFDYEADASEFGDPGPGDITDLASFRRSDGVEVTTMRPVPDPEDMDPQDRWRTYGR